MKCSLLMGAVVGWIWVTVTGCGGTTDGGDALGTPAEGGTSNAGSPSSAGSAGSPSSGGTSGSSGVQGGSAGAAPSGGTGNANSGSSSAGATAGAGGSVGSTPTTGLHADGGQIKNGQGQVVQIHGVNRSGSEYECVQTKASIFDGNPDDASAKLMATWNANAVRVPLNESCWLGINGAPAANSGAAYKKAITDYVTVLHNNNMIPILELHWVGPGSSLATLQQPMPDADHAPAFWTDVAMTFAADEGVIFEVYNEPFPGSNMDSTAAWTCWRDGCMANLANETSNTGNGTYQAVGLQALVTAIRGVSGAKQLILLGGLEYSNDLSMWSQYKPTDPLDNLGAAWHIYNYNSCTTSTCWDGAPATLAMTTPIVVTELGENDCQGSFVTPLMTWLDQHSLGYLAWSWNAYGACTASSKTGQGGQPWSLITSQTNGTPNGGFAQAVHDHFLTRP
jgi:hypothetical protein